jgi:hypothetical protein
MFNYNMSYQSVNGQPCSYAKLKTYANCARAEKRPAVAAAAAPAPVAVAAPAPVAVAAAPAAPAAPAAAAPVAPVAPVAEKYGMMESYLDPSPDSLPGNANSGEKNYTPSYRVPNFPPITTDTLISEDNTCGGYRKILGAYGGMSGSSCTTNYINN